MNRREFLGLFTAFLAWLGLPKPLAQESDASDRANVFVVPRDGVYLFTSGDFGKEWKTFYLGPNGGAINGCEIVNGDIQVVGNNITIEDVTFTEDLDVDGTRVRLPPWDCEAPSDYVVEWDGEVYANLKGEA